ncbi:hypothetical protein DSO57_1002577 [Entomophthora muscae]|uniref:Uncharacterized protein n=1 Tax=Entomophthora muscae TaxID=34485 RepID=A0ACC2U7W1_9FUNG|nr:hypothetical protein DSO57_1002577 [Entomophthora muscae]
MTRIPTKVVTAKKVRNKEVKLTYFEFDPVYFQEAVPAATIEKVKTVLDTSYKPYISDGNQEGQEVLNNAVAFYIKVPMSCVPVTNQDPDSSAPKRPCGVPGH